MYDSNIIMLRPMKNITYKEFIHVFQDLHDHLNTRGLKRNYTQLENEASYAFQDLLKEKNTNYQLDPPGMNRRNVLERAIIKFKYHFITGLYLTEPYLPMQNWD